MPRHNYSVRNSEHAAHHEIQSVEIAWRFKSSFSGTPLCMSGNTGSSAALWPIPSTTSPTYKDTISKGAGSNSCRRCPTAVTLATSRDPAVRFTALELFGLGNGSQAKQVISGSAVVLSLLAFPAGNSDPLLHDDTSSNAMLTQKRPPAQKALSLNSTVHSARRRLKGK